MKFWNREIETMSRDALEALQLKGLQKTLRRVWACDWWRDLLHKRGMSDPQDVKSLDDLRNLPFLTKEAAARWKLLGPLDCSLPSLTDLLLTSAESWLAGAC